MLSSFGLINMQSFPYFPQHTRIRLSLMPLIRTVGKTRKSMAVWGVNESTEEYTAEALATLRRFKGVRRLDGKFTGAGYWVLQWRGVFPETEPRQIVRTISFQRYAKAVSNAAALERLSTPRKPPAIEPSGSNARAVK